MGSPLYGHFLHGRRRDVPVKSNGAVESTEKR